MKDKLQLNKNGLRAQRAQLSLYREFLPVLQLRKQQLSLAVREVKAKISELLRTQSNLVEETLPWASLLLGDFDRITALVSVRSVDVRTINVAGVQVAHLDGVQFEDRPYPLLDTPLFFDEAVALLQRAWTLREQRRVLQTRAERLRDELQRTTQRINLYEKVMIPKAEQNIRRIKVYLGDQQVQAVCRAKMAKSKGHARREDHDDR